MQGVVPTSIKPLPIKMRWVYPLFKMQRKGKAQIFRSDEAKSLMPAENILIAGTFVSPIPFTLCPQETRHIQSMFCHLGSIPRHYICYGHHSISEMAVIKMNLLICHEAA
jgi:hypothetical protein